MNDVTYCASTVLCTVLYCTSNYKQFAYCSNSAVKVSTLGLASEEEGEGKVVNGKQGTFLRMLLLPARTHDKQHGCVHKINYDDI